MIFYIIPISNGINLDPIELQNCRIENGVLFGDDVCIGNNVDIDNFGIKCGDKVIINDAPILRPWTGDYPNYCTWLNWSENGICKIY